MEDFFKNIFNIVTKKEVYGVVVIIALTYFVYKTISIFIEQRIVESKGSYEKKKRKTIAKLIQNVLKYVIIIIASLGILSLYGINVTAMVAGLGITATIIGLALQDTFKDIISGISIIAENYFVVGDTIKYGTFTGEVIEFGLKSTKIKDVSGNVLMVANRNIMEVINISQKENTIPIILPLPYEVAPAKIEKLIKDKIIPRVKAEIENVIEEKTIYLGIDKLADSSINYKFLVGAKRDTQWQVERETKKICVEELNKAKISIPYPQLEVHKHEK